jgi:hypothetical protein
MFLSDTAIDPSADDLAKIAITQQNSEMFGNSNGFIFEFWFIE